MSRPTLLSLDQKQAEMRVRMLSERKERQRRRHKSHERLASTGVVTPRPFRYADGPPIALLRSQARWQLRRIPRREGHPRLEAAHAPDWGLLSGLLGPDGGCGFTGADFRSMCGPGVYVFVLDTNDGTEPLYVGSSGVVLSRASTKKHLQGHDARILATRVLIYQCRDLTSARRAEEILIGALRPRYNVRQRYGSARRNLGLVANGGSSFLSGILPVLESRVRHQSETVVGQPSSVGEFVGPSCEAKL